MEFIEACKTGCLVSVKEHLQDPDAHLDQRGLTFAAGAGYVEIVKALLADSRIDPSWHKEEAYRTARLLEQYSTAKILLEAKK